jgi:transcription initiation factor TFIIIB Brf1 subunit/transcription initiation factor TFIIB
MSIELRRAARLSWCALLYSAGKCPLSVAAAAVVMVCRCSDKEIVRVSNVSLTTVRNCIQMLEDHRAELLEGVELPSEPFHFRCVAICGFLY